MFWRVWTASTVSNLGDGLVLAATSDAVVAGAALACFGLSGEVWNVIAVSYRQSVVPERLLGRVMATYRVIAYGAFPVGALLGGALGKAVGLRAGIAAGAVLTLGLAVYLRAALGGSSETRRKGCRARGRWTGACLSAVDHRGGGERHSDVRGSCEKAGHGSAFR